MFIVSNEELYSVPIIEGRSGYSLKDIEGYSGHYPGNFTRITRKYIPEGYKTLPNQRIVCGQCGAERKSNTCEYCGSEYREEKKYE